VGLVAKIVAVRPVVDAASWPLALVAAANVALGLVYYLRWGALLFVSTRGAGGGGAAPGSDGVPSWRVRPAEGLALGAAAAGCIVLSVWPQLIAGVVPGVVR
jgi:NADH-quinone oxidoreductase subunit N